MASTVVRSEHDPKPRRWLVIFDYLFYLALLLVVAGVAYYFYYYLSTPMINSLEGKFAMILWFPILLQKLGITLAISLVSVVLATLLGFAGALGRLTRIAPLRWLTTIYVEVVRGTPILVQLLFWYFGVAQLLSQAGFNPYSSTFDFMTLLQSNSLIAGIDPALFDAFFWGIIGLSFNYGAYLTEVFRTGIESVDKGQTEAALSLGLNARQTMRRVVLPQALRITLPPFTNYFITLIQDSALLSVLGVTELEQQVGALAVSQNDSSIKLFIYFFGAIYYLIVCFALALLARFLEARFARAY
ncbi:MAG TPA: amino acid ABC transporter permease [Ktedonobacteraceae bacterium]|nr:amino acid ABC transporter permease [Ktedonobacteraceae bacterium]